MPKSLHGLGLLIAPKGSSHDEPDGDEGDETLHEACKELADVLDVPDEKYEDFSDALGAYVDAKMAQHREEPE